MYTVTTFILVIKVLLAFICDLLQTMLNAKYFFGETRRPPLHLTRQSVVESCWSANATSLVMAVFKFT